MHLEILVEEPSAEVALQELIPKIVKDQATFGIRVHQGKQDLLQKLPDRLRGYRAWLPSDYRIVVLADEDRKDCRELKAKLERIARDAGFRTASDPGEGGAFQVLNRIAVEELEAWFFGDVAALREAFPRIPETLHRKAGFRDPDAIAGGTWEALQGVLQRANYYTSWAPKIEVARKVSGFLDPSRNKSHSFRVFREGLLRMVEAS